VHRLYRSFASLVGPDPHVEHMSTHATSPDKYDISCSMPPTPRQVRYILADHGIETLCDLLRTFWKKDSTHPR